MIPIIQRPSARRAPPYDRQYECRGDPDYIDRNDHIGYNASYRRKIIELYLTVGPH